MKFHLPHWTGFCLSAAWEAKAGGSLVSIGPNLGNTSLPVCMYVWCVYACLHVCAGACPHVYTSEYGGPKLKAGVLLALHFIETGFLS